MKAEDTTKPPHDETLAMYFSGGVLGLLGLVLLWSFYLAPDLMRVDKVSWLVCAWIPLAMLAVFGFAGGIREKGRRRRKALNLDALKANGEPEGLVMRQLGRFSLLAGAGLGFLLWSLRRGPFGKEQANLIPLLGTVLALVVLGFYGMLGRALWQLACAVVRRGEPVASRRSGLRLLLGGLASWVLIAVLLLGLSLGRYRISIALWGLALWAFYAVIEGIGRLVFARNLVSVAFVLWGIYLAVPIAVLGLAFGWW